MEKQYDLIIIGAGPAGMSAAVYGSRAGLKTVMIESGAPGGKLLKTFKIANYPGVGEQSGADLAAAMFEQSTAFGAEYAYGNVVDITKDKVVTLEDGTKIEGKAIIVATGTREKLMDVPGEVQNIGRGVSFCAVCDGAFFRDKDVAVVGSGNAALEESAFLTQFARSVTIVVKGDRVSADPTVQDMVKDNEKVRFIFNSVPKAVLSEGNKVSALEIRDTHTDEVSTLSVSGIFPYEGQNPMSAALKNLDVLDSRGYVEVDRNMETKVHGIYAAGDIVEKELRQVVTATNDGAIAAQHANKVIRTRK